MHANNGNGKKQEPSTNGTGMDLSSLSLVGSSNHELNGATNRRGQGDTLTQERSERKKFSESSPRLSLAHSFDSPVILQQSSLWSRALLWGLMGVTTAAVVWACIAKIEEAIPAAGKLEPVGTVKEVQAPIGGVVKAIHVEDGQRVKAGDRLLELDSTASKAQLASLQKIRTSLRQENQFYTTVIGGSTDSTRLGTASTFLQLPPQLVSLTKSRTALSADNQLYRALLNGTRDIHLNPEQLERLQSTTAELDSRVAAAVSESEQLAKQLSQARIRFASTQATLKMNQAILQDFIPLARDGAMSRIQLLKQQQEVQTAQAEAQQLIQEQARLKLAIAQANSKLQNTVALSRKEWLTQIADNGKQIAEIDSQLTKAIVENNKEIAEVDSQLSQARLSLRYEELVAPASGTVFDLLAHTPGFVANTSQSLLKIVPDETLTAKVFITNSDIGFVKENMDVDVRIDSFPFSEFGDIKGKLVWIGSDTLPPDSIHPYYRFPAKVRLERQSLSINGRKVPLQSGMSVSANVKVRDRRVINIFTDLFTKSFESLKFVR